MSADVRAGRFPRGLCAHCREFHHVTYGDLLPEIRSLRDEYPLELESPFEGVESISGGVWRASEIMGGDDALLRLHFRENTRKLPLHSHNHSDRVIFVAEGRGVFEYLMEGAAKKRRSIDVEAGDALVFSRGTIHTFKTADSDLQLLSYHSPYIELNDERQFSLYQ